MLRPASMALALVLAGSLAGCLEGAGPTPTSLTPGADEEEWVFGGAWTQEYTQADIDAWCEIAREYDNECIVMESFPPQYILRFETEALCREARAKVLALPHITARECSRIEPSDDPDGSVSSPPAGTGTDPTDATAWRLHGTFWPGYNAGNIDRWCELAIELGQTCALMKSEPPQFSWSFETHAACEDAQLRLQGLDNLSARPCSEIAPADAVYDVRAFDVSWSSSTRGPERMQWDVVRAWGHDGLVTVNVTTQGIEGGDFRFKLWLRPAGDGAETLAHETGATRAGTFDFHYTEAVFWSGRSIVGVDSVDPSSTLRIEREDASGALSGSFDLRFVGKCQDPDCTRQPLDTRLVGTFGP